MAKVAAPVEPVAGPAGLELLATASASAPPSGKRAANARASDAVEVPLGWAVASLQVMLQRAPTGKVTDSKSVSSPGLPTAVGLSLTAAERARK